MKLIGFLLLSVALATVYDLNSQGEVLINPSSTVYLEINSTPSTGYIWYLVPTDSTKLTVQDPLGVLMTPETKLLGAPLRQRFELSCNELCESGEILQIILEKRHGAVQDIAEMRTVDIEVTDDKLN